MATSRLFFLFSLFCVCLQSCFVVGQEDPFAKDPFEPFENPFRHVPEGETTEQRALALLRSQKYSINQLEASIDDYKAMLSQEQQRRIAVQSVLSNSLNRHFQGSIEDQKFALNLLDSYLKTYSAQEGKSSLIWLDGVIEDHLEKGLQSDELQTDVVRLFERHLTSKGLILGYQPSNGNWRPVSDVTEKELGETRARLSSRTDFDYLEFALEDLLYDLSITAGVDFHAELSDEQKALEITYVNKNVSFGKALSDILTRHDLDFRVDKESVHIGSRDDRSIAQNDIFVVKGLLSSEVDIEKLVELVKTEFKEHQPEFHLIDQNTFATIGTETQLKKVARYLGGFRTAPQDNETDSAKSLHPAAVFANQVVKAVRNEDSEGLLKLAQVDEDNKYLFLEFVEEVGGWFQGVNEVREIRRNGDSYFAKLRTFGNEVMVIRMDRKDGEYVLSDFNSPSVEDYQELELVPLTQDQE